MERMLGSFHTIAILVLHGTIHTKTLDLLSLIQGQHMKSTETHLVISQKIRIFPLHRSFVELLGLFDFECVVAHRNSQALQRSQSAACVFIRVQMMQRVVSVKIANVNTTMNPILIGGIQNLMR
jgi:hypothetical protein